MVLRLDLHPRSSPRSPRFRVQEDLPHIANDSVFDANRSNTSASPPSPQPLPRLPRPVTPPVTVTARKNKVRRTTLATIFFRLVRWRHARRAVRWRSRRFLGQQANHGEATSSETSSATKWTTWQLRFSHEDRRTTDEVGILATHAVTHRTRHQWLRFGDTHAAESVAYTCAHVPKIQHFSWVSEHWCCQLLNKRLVDFMALDTM